MGFLRFLGRNLVASFFGAVGLILMGLGYADQATDIWKAAQPWQLQAGGAAFFVIAIILILYRWDQEHVRRMQELGPVCSSIPVPVQKKPIETPNAVASLPFPAEKRTVQRNVDGRVFVGQAVSTKQLMHVFRQPGKLKVQAQREVGVYIGKWMKIAGKVDNVSRISLLTGQTPRAPSRSCERHSFTNSEKTLMRGQPGGSLKQRLPA